MPKFKWEGLDRKGKSSSGQIEAKSIKDAKKKLRARGYLAKKVKSPGVFEVDLGEFLVSQGIGAAFGAKELMMFTKQLSIMIEAGVPILTSLEILYKSEKNPSLKKAVQKITVEVGEGKTLADSMKKQKGFGALYCNLVHAGEEGGILDQILRKLTEHLEKNEKIKAQIKSAMMYPGIVTLIGIVVVWGMLTFVVPMMETMVKQNGNELPEITQMVIDTSDFLRNNFMTIIISFFGTLFLLSRSTKEGPGKKLFDLFSMKMPIFGQVVIKGNLASFTRTLATLVSSGVGLIDALDICLTTIDNIVIVKDLKKVKNAVVRGKTMTEPLGKIPYFPELVVQMVRIGEQTGSLDKMLGKISDVFEDEVNMTVSNSTKLIEPIIIICLGGVIAVILIAMYLPIFTSAG